MIQHISILSIFPFVRISKIRTYAPSFEMNRPPPNGVHNLTAGILRKAEADFVTLGEN